MADLLDDASIVSESVDRYPIPSSRRHRYEDLDRFPEGLLVVGDAIASFNPIYAQGMTVGPDFEYPETGGPRPSGSRIAGWYVGRLQRRARRDPVLTEALSRVIQFEQPPSSLFRPKVLWRVLAPFPRRRSRSTSTPSDGSDSLEGVTASGED